MARAAGHQGPAAAALIPAATSSCLSHERRGARALGQEGQAIIKGPAAGRPPQAAALGGMPQLISWWLRLFQLETELGAEPPVGDDLSAAGVARCPLIVLPALATVRA